MAARYIDNIDKLAPSGYDIEINLFYDKIIVLKHVAK